MKTLKPFLLCIIILVNLNLSAQIIYTDIIPDTILLPPPIPVGSGSATNSYDFDINNDSDIDLSFELMVSKSYMPEFEVYEVIKIIDIEPVDSLFVIIVNWNNCMLVLEQYDTINVNQSWSPTPGYGAVITGNSYYTQNKNINLICNPANTFQYCGINLIANGNNYYGWIRLSWGSNYLKIHDFAYNATPDEIILAGETGLTDINEINQNFPFTISHYHGKLEITSALQNNKIDKVRLIGISGQCIRDIEINNFKASINTSNIPAGFYIVQIVQSDNIFVQKLFISNN